MQTQIEFLAVGDIVTDAFIELEEAWVETDNPEHAKELCMRFGDKIPYRSVVVAPAVGNSPNAAVAAARLGVSAALATDMGDDEYGKEMRASLEREKVPLSYARVHAGRPSNYHYVLRFKTERTILVKHEEYPRRFPAVAPAPKWMYLSSLGGGSESYHDEVADWLDAHPETKLAFQPGTFQMKMGARRLSRLYRRAEVFFCNKEEAQRILETTESDAKKLLSGIRSLGAKTAVITDGPDGAYAEENGGAWSIPMYPDPKPPIERTGAGDAFSAAFTVALLLGESVPEALRWGPINSAFVVQQIGAQKGLLSRAELKKHLADAPADYCSRKM